MTFALSVSTSKKREPWHAKVRADLARNRLTAKDLASRIGVPGSKASKVARWISGENAAKFEDVSAIADALGISLDFLAGRIPAPNEEWTDDDYGRALKTLSADARKVVALLNDPRAAAYLARAADQFVELERSRAR